MYVFETKVPHILLLYISYSTSDATFPVPHIRESYQKGKLVSSSAVLVLYEEHSVVAACRQVQEQVRFLYEGITIQNVTNSLVLF